MRAALAQLAVLLLIASSLLPVHDALCDLIFPAFGTPLPAHKEDVPVSMYVLIQCHFTNPADLSMLEQNDGLLQITVDVLNHADTGVNFTQAWDTMKIVRQLPLTPLTNSFSFMVEDFSLKFILGGLYQRFAFGVFTCKAPDLRCSELAMLHTVVVKSGEDKYGRHQMMDNKRYCAFPSTSIFSTSSTESPLEQCTNSPKRLAFIEIGTSGFETLLESSRYAP